MLVHRGNSFSTLGEMQTQFFTTGMGPKSHRAAATCNPFQLVHSGLCNFTNGQQTEKLFRESLISLVRCAASQGATREIESLGLFAGRVASRTLHP